MVCRVWGEWMGSKQVSEAFLAHTHTKTPVIRVLSRTEPYALYPMSHTLCPDHEFVVIIPV